MMRHLLVIVFIFIAFSCSNEQKNVIQISEKSLVTEHSQIVGTWINMLSDDVKGYFVTIYKEGGGVYVETLKNDLSFKTEKVVFNNNQYKGKYENRYHKINQDGNLNLITSLNTITYTKFPMDKRTLMLDKIISSPEYGRHQLPFSILGISSNSQGAIKVGEWLHESKKVTIFRINSQFYFQDYTTWIYPLYKRKEALFVEAVSGRPMVIDAEGNLELYKDKSSGYTIYRNINNKTASIQNNENPLSKYFGKWHDFTPMIKGVVTLYIKDGKPHLHRRFSLDESYVIKELTHEGNGMFLYVDDNQSGEYIQVNEQKWLEFYDSEGLIKKLPLKK